MSIHTFLKIHYSTLLILLLFPPFASCSGFQKERTTSGGSSGDVVEHVPSPASYYHTILGLQYEGEGNDQAALKEYLSALEEDPSAVFLLNRVAASLHRIGAGGDALSYAERALRLQPNDTRTLRLLGNIHIASGRMNKALDAYQRVIQLQPNEVEVYFTLAGIYANENNLEKAEEMVRKAVDADPDSPLGYYYLGKIAVDRTSLEEGLEYYQKALSLNPSFEQAHLGVGHVYELQGRLREAEEVYRRLLETVHSGSREGEARLIQLLIKEKSFDEALELLEALAQAAPSNPEIALQTAMVWVEKKDFQKAIEKVSEVIRATPGDLRLRLYLAALYEENKEYEKAISIYQEALEKGLAPDPKDRTLYDVRIRLGSLYFYRLKKGEEALAQGRMAVKIDPQKSEAYLFSGLVLHDLNRYDEAVQTFIQGIEKNPKAADLHFHLGATYDKLNRFDDLVGEMERTIQLDSKHANALNYLGYTFAEKGVRLNDAIDLINRALSIRPDDGYFIDSLGWAYYKKGMLQEAMTALQKAVLLLPDDPTIHEHLGEVYLKDNRTDLAREEWNRSLRLDPKNDKLISRFKQAGLGDPILDEHPQRTNDPPKNPPTETSNQNKIPQGSLH